MIDLLAELDAAYGVKTAGGAGDLLKAVGRIAAPAGRAASGYVSRLAGYGPRGPLQGQKLFDSSTVPVPLTRAEPRPDLVRFPGLAAVHERVAQKAPLLADAFVPTGIPHPLRVGDELAAAGSRAVYALDRQPLLHPVVQAARTVGHVLGTPVTVPPLRAAADAASAAGRTRLSTVLEAAAETNQLAGRAMFYGGLGLGAHAVNRQLKAQAEATGADTTALGGQWANLRGVAGDPETYAGLMTHPPAPGWFDQLRAAIRRLTLAGHMIDPSAT